MNVVVAKKPSQDPAYRGKDVTKWTQRDHSKRVDTLAKKSMGDLMGLKALIGIEIRQNPKDISSLSLIEMHIDSAITRKKRDEREKKAELIEATQAYEDHLMVKRVVAKAPGSAFLKAILKPAKALRKAVQAIITDAEAGRESSLDGKGIVVNEKAGELARALFALRRGLGGDSRMWTAQQHVEAARVQWPREVKMAAASALKAMQVLDAEMQKLVELGGAWSDPTDEQLALSNKAMDYDGDISRARQQVSELVRAMR